MERSEVYESLIRGFSWLMDCMLRLDELSSQTDRVKMEELALKIKLYSTPQAIEQFLYAVGMNSDEIGHDPYNYKKFSQLQGIWQYISDISKK